MSASSIHPGPGAEFLTPADRGGWGYSIGFALLVFLVTRLILTLIGGYSFKLIGMPAHWMHMFLQWDGNYYLSIVQQGYVLPVPVTGNEDGQSNLNFFPLLPLGAWLVGLIVKPALLAGLVFSNACLLLAAVMLHRLAGVRFGRAAADASVLSLLLLPGSFAFSGFMTEAPFLAFSITAAYVSHQSRHGWAAASGALLSITRLTGAVQAMGFGLDWMIARGRGQPVSYRQVFWICLTPVPLFIYFAYMFHATGDAMAAIHSNFSFWHQRFGFPFENFWMVTWVTQPQLQIQCVVGIVLLLVLLSQAWSFSAGEWFFVLFSLVMTSSANSLSPSLLRYMVALYPLHIAMGRLCVRFPAARFLLALLAMVNAALAIAWFHGLNAYI